MNLLDRICPPLNRGVTVLGGAQTRFGISKKEPPEPRDLAAEAVAKTLRLTGVDPSDIDLVIVSNAVGFAVAGQGHMNACISGILGTPPTPSLRLETACASGSVAFHMGAMAIEAGWADVVLIVGVEVMSGMDRFTTQKVLAGGSDVLLEASVGATFPGLYAAYGMRYINEFAPDVMHGLDSLSYIALKNHKFAEYNPEAQFPISIEKLAEKKGYGDVWEFLHNPKTNPVIAFPLRLFDCSPISDGGAALILTGSDVADSYSSPLRAQLKATAMTTGHMPMGREPSPLSLSAAVYAAEAAYKRAGVDKNNPLSSISVAEVHDCFTSAEVMALGDLGFFPRKDCLDAARKGWTDIGGKIPVNTSGGLKAKGHPIAVTGISQIIWLLKQIAGEVDKNVRVDNIGLALAHNIGGTGGTGCVNILAPVP